jgi:hypothetical protein
VVPFSGRSDDVSSRFFSVPAGVGTAAAIVFCWYCHQLRSPRPTRAAAPPCSARQSRYTALHNNEQNVRDSPAASDGPRLRARAICHHCVFRGPVRGPGARALTSGRKLAVWGTGRVPTVQARSCDFAGPRAMQSWEVGK